MSAASIKLRVCCKCNVEFEQGNRIGRPPSFCSGCQNSLKQEERRRAAARQGRPYHVLGDYKKIRSASAKVAAQERPAKRQEAILQKQADVAARKAAEIKRKPWLACGLSARERYAIRYREDRDFHVRERLRAAMRRRRNGAKFGDMLRQALKRGGGAPSIESFLGYTVADLRRHLERKFISGMTWDAFCVGDIHIDHKRPLASFDLGDRRQLREAWALTNLQPLWAATNLKKGAYFDGNWPHSC